MLVWRLCRRPHADLSGEGGRLYSGRWHSAGRPVIYAAESPALAILEVRVHFDLPYDLLPDDYVLMSINLDLAEPNLIELAGAMPDHPREFGDIWLTQRRSCVLAVPSVIAPRGLNFLINPLHPGIEDVRIESVEAFRFDPRLWNIF
jgi:RES domain-containing protein